MGLFSWLANDIKNMFSWIKQKISREIEWEEVKPQIEIVKEPIQIKPTVEILKEVPKEPVITETTARSIYIYCWAYDKDAHLPVKEEYEIHNFVTDKTENELEDEEWLINLMQGIEKRHIELHPNSDRYPTARIGYDNIRPSWKPSTRQATIYEYTLYTEWQKAQKTGKKFRNYKKRNQKKFNMEID